MLRSVLLVEDSLSIQAYMKALLTDLGVKNVVCADNGLQALEAIDNNGAPFHGIITDLNMPEMDGLEFLTRLGQSGFTGGVIITSSLEDRVIEIAVDLARRQKVRLVGFLHKPVKAESLSLMLQRIRHVHRIEILSHNMLKKSALEEALREKRLVPYYQPKINPHTQKVIGFEVLCRMSVEGESHLISPDRFIPVAEKFDKIDELTLILMDIAFAEFSQISQHYPSDLKLAFNLAPQQLLNIRTTNIFDDYCQRYNISPEKIVIEVTERQMLEGEAQLSTLDRLRIHGYGVSLDDFGTGFTNMGQLRSYPFSEIKLDQSLVANITNDRLSQIILRSMNDISKELGIELVAEGIENIEDYNYVANNSEAQVQGYLICRPKPKSEIIRWLRAWEAEHPEVTEENSEP